MIEVSYIGRLMEDLDLQQEREQFELRGGIADVASLIELLCSERGEQWSTALHQENLLVSVNHSMVKTDHPLADGDEVIFFPPIAGG
jgi:molybdopterin synthase sulfur carrier subunit